MSGAAWVHLEYDNASRVVLRRLRNGVESVYTYDNGGMNRIVSIKHYKTHENQPDVLLARLDYPANQYDEVGNWKKVERMKFPSADPLYGDGSSTAYQYDDLYQLMEESFKAQLDAVPV